jgi:drug/metabolite transporter (DMT)-like permease
MKRPPFFGIILAAVGTLVLTPDSMFMRLSAMNGTQMFAWRGLLMGTMLLLGWLLSSRHRGRDLRAVATGGGLTIIACQYVNATLFSLGIATAPAAIVLFGLATVPIFAAIFTWLIIGERTGRATWVTIALVMAGIGIAVLSGNSGQFDFNLASVLGALAGLGVASVLALNFVVLKARPALPILLVIGIGALLAGLTGLALTGVPDMARGHVWAIAITGAIILPFSFFTLSLAARYTHASNVSLLMLLETVLGPIWVWLAIGEAMTPGMIIGGTIVIVSLAIYLMLPVLRLSREKRQDAS